MANRVAPPTVQDARTDRALSDLSKAVDSNVALPAFPVVIDAKVQVESNSFRHLAPRATGMEVTIPTAEAKNFGQRITLFVDGQLGTCRIRPISGRINALTSITLLAGYTTLLELVSNGKAGWAVATQTASAINTEIRLGILHTESGASGTLNIALTTGATRILIQSTGPVTLGSISGAADGRVLIVEHEQSSGTGLVTVPHSTSTNFISTGNATDMQLGHRGAMVLVGRGTVWRCVAVNHTQAVTSRIETDPTSGAQGVVDITGVVCGGMYSFANVSESSIDGFSVKEDGFWFICHYRDSTGSGVIRLRENAGNTTTSIRTPNLRDLMLFRDDAVMMYYTNSRWRCLRTFNKMMTSADEITLAAQTDNYARTSEGISRIRIALTGNQTLTGVVFLAGQANGELLFIENADSVDTLTIAHDSTSTAANRFFCPDSVDLKLGPRSGSLWVYDTTSDRWKPMFPSPHGRLLTRTVLTSGTGATFTHDPAARFFIVKGCGGGGAGGGADGGGATAGSLGAGGGSATYGERLYLIGATTSTYTVGPGGTGVSGAAGNNGTASTWLHNSVTLTLPSGNGGGRLTAGATFALQSGGLGGGSATNADTFTAGERGDWGGRLSAATAPATGGKGGSTPWGMGGSPGVAATAGSGPSNGAAGGGPGAGGGGQCNGASNTSSAGPDGFRGQFIVEEYS